MAGIVPYAIWAVLIISGLSLLTIAVFGLRALTFGNVNPLSIVLMAIPGVLLVVLGFAMGDWAHAAVLTFLIALALTSLSLLMSGIRSLFGM